MAKKARKKEKLKSLQVLRQRKHNKQSELQLKQRKTEMALKTELMHKLEVHFATVDTLQLEVADNVLADFLVILEDPAITSLYTYTQDYVDEHLFTFTPRAIF